MPSLYEENTPCSRPESREARAIIGSRVLEVARGAGAGELATTCPLHSQNDALKLHEAAKRRMSGHNWKCLLCGKAFRSERYMDLHLHRKHADTAIAPSWPHSPNRTAQARVEERAHARDGPGASHRGSPCALRARRARLLRVGHRRRKGLHVRLLRP